MDNSHIWLLSFIVFVPALGALLLALLPRLSGDVTKFITLIITIVVFIPTLVVANPLGMFGTENEVLFQFAADRMQNVFTVPWIPSSLSRFPYILDPPESDEAPNFSPSDQASGLRPG